MHITVKTLKGEIINVDIDQQATILELKEKIKELKGIEVESQKIVFKGKASNNTDVLTALGVKENDFLVVMTVVKKPETKPKEEPKKEEKKAQEKPQENKVEEKSQNKPKPPQQQEKQQSNSAQFEASVNELLLMGFDREKCVEALRAAFGNTDRAVEYLINGIPQNPIQQPAQQMPGQQLGGQQLGGQLGGDGNPAEQVFRALVHNPAFAQIKQLIRNDPSALQPILQQISQTSPELYAIIAQNPQAFQRVIMQDAPEGSGQVPNMPQQPPPNAIQITPQEHAAIERLMNFGFSKMDAAQAYFACDKNEELAANLLFDRLANGDLQPMEEGSGQQGGNEGGNNEEDDDDDNLFN